MNQYLTFTWLLVTAQSTESLDIQNIAPLLLNTTWLYRHTYIEYINVPHPQTLELFFGVLCGTRHEQLICYISGKWSCCVVKSAMRLTFSWQWMFMWKMTFRRTRVQIFWISKMPKQGMLPLHAVYVFTCNTLGRSKCWRPRHYLYFTSN